MAPTQSNILTLLPTMRTSSYAFAKKLSNDSIDEDVEYKETNERFKEEFDHKGDVVRVANLIFVDGELGRGSYGSVRLARRKIEKPKVENHSTFFPAMPLSPFRTPSPHRQHESGSGKRRDSRRSHLGRSMSEPTCGSFFESANSNGHSPRTPLVVGRLGLLVRNPSGESARGAFYVDKYTDDDSEELVAVKIFRKSILKKMRTMERIKETRKVQIKTALMKVEREIAIMKKLNHPNLIQLYEVFESPESDMLYIVLEYMPLGEILTYQKDGTFRRKEPKDGHEQIPGLIDGHFDEEASAFFFVDILHGLAYLHDNRIIHRDLKPENILLQKTPSGFPIAKLSDFGVSHMFEDELNDNDNRSDTKHQYELKPAGLTKHHLERAISMSRKSDSGLLTKTEGTYCFWSPEMCQGGQAFSGYAADIWAAGICLYIFVSGRLPFFSDAPLNLMEAIAEGEVPFDSLDVSDACLSLLKMTLEKDPSQRAGVGDCLQHPFLKDARAQRISQLSDEFRMSHREIIIGEEDLRAAFQIVTRIPSVLIKSAAKHVEVAGKRLARLTKAASTSFHSDQSPASTRSIINQPQRSASIVLSDASDATNNSFQSQPTSLPVISSGSDGNMDDNAEDCRSEGRTPTSRKDDKKEEGHHRRKTLFSSIFRRSKTPDNSHELHSKNTC